MKQLQEYLINEAKDPFYKLTSDAQMCRHNQDIAQKSLENLKDLAADALKPYIGKNLNIRYDAHSKRGRFAIEEIKGSFEGFGEDGSLLIHSLLGDLTINPIDIYGINEV